MSEQLQLSMIVELRHPDVRVRFDGFERALLDRVRQQTGLPMSAIVRRCVDVFAADIIARGEAKARKKARAA